MSIEFESFILAENLFIVVHTQHLTLTIKWKQFIMKQYGFCCIWVVWDADLWNLQQIQRAYIALFIK